MLTILELMFQNKCRNLSTNQGCCYVEVVIHGIVEFTLLVTCNSATLLSRIH